MMRRFCNRCEKPTQPLAESTTVVLREGDKVWRLAVSVPRGNDLDLCLECRQEIAKLGDWPRMLTEEDVQSRPLPVLAEGV